MPEYLRVKLRRLQKLHEDAKQLDFEIKGIIEGYGVDTDNLCAVGNGDKQTEALAFITNAEGDVEENIADIEAVFLHYVNTLRK